MAKSKTPAPPTAPAPTTKKSGLDDAGKILGAIGEALLPLAGTMLAAIMGGEDPLNAIAKQRLEDIIPREKRLKLAMLAERTRRGLPLDEES